MGIRTLLAGTAAALLILVVSADGLLSQPPARFQPQITGEFGFWNGVLWATVDLTMRGVRDGRLAAGLVDYRDDDGAGQVRYYRAALDAVKVEGARATVSGHVTDTNVPEWAGMGVQLWFCDRGSPGHMADEVAGMFFQWPGSLPYAYPPMATPVMAGNLVIH